MDILTLFLGAVKGKIIPLWTKLKRWSSPGGIRTQLLAKAQRFLGALLDVRPRDNKDYYPLFGWLVGKKLASAILLGIGMLSACYVLAMNASAPVQTGAALRTYPYDSILLRFTQGHVRILAKSGYLAYEGEVKGGTVSGEGKLFYPDGSPAYRGTFENNVYEGSGSLFRESGMLEYTGGFSRGVKEGEGMLYDTGGNPVYQGNFSGDRLLYRELPGKSTQEVSDRYTGRRTIYTDADYFAVCLHDIDAVYYGSSSAELLDESRTVTGVYVLQDCFYEKGNRIRSVKELERCLGTLNYEGNSAVIMPEAVALANLPEGKARLCGAATMKTEAVFADVLQVISYDTDYLIYLYSYEKDGLRYTFFCQDRLGEFDFYSIEKAEA